jgi:hypothetical protein
MQKLCVFCGNHPVSKTKEHVIPYWLISLTGNPKRNVTLGIDWLKDRPAKREFSFDQYTFPACSSCNQTFSSLEDMTQRIVTDLLNEQPLSEDSLNVLLDWFDKVRVGLWLAELKMNPGFFGVKPKFHIAKRISTSDRLLMIFKTTSTTNGVTFSGTDGPVFALYPSCFGLRINQFYFINASDILLFSRRLGLPFPELENRKKHSEGSKLLPGLQRVLRPLIPQIFDARCTQIYQPIIPPELRDEEIMSSLYNNAYAKSFFVNDPYIGNILIYQNDRIVPYCAVPGTAWIPKTTFDSFKMENPYLRQILVFQNTLINRAIAIIETDPPEKTFMLKQYRGLLKFNLLILKNLDQQIKDSRSQTT